jgi:hypothetical protein
MLRLGLGPGAMANVVTKSPSSRHYIPNEQGRVFSQTSAAARGIIHLIFNGFSIFTADIVYCRHFYYRTALMSQGPWLISAVL